MSKQDFQGFCDVCYNLLEEQTTADTFSFKCGKCETTKKPTDEDSLRYEDATGTDFTIFRSILNNAGRDNMNPKAIRQCECGYNRVRQVRLGENMQIINTCIKCNAQWFDGTRDTDLNQDLNQNLNQDLTKDTDKTAPRKPVTGKKEGRKNKSSA